MAFRTAALLAALLGIASAAEAQTPPEMPSEAVIAATRQIDINSKITGRTYRVQIALPIAPPPPGGYPTLYVLDGAGMFGTWADLARGRAAAMGIEQAIVVGISYPGAGLMQTMALRFKDLTPTAGKPGAYPLPPGTETGGADAFLQALQTEIKPAVAKLVPVNPKRDMFLGHSLGGLTVLHALLRTPGDYSTFLISSPSIWWDDKAVLADEAAFSAQVKAGKVAPRILIGVGGKEQTVDPTAPVPPGFTPEKLKALTDSARMVDNAKELGARLAALPGGPGYQVETRVFDGEDHMSVIWGSANAIANFALPFKAPVGGK